MTADSIFFPGLNITFLNIGRGIDISNFHIAYYGLVIGIGMLIAALFISKNSISYGESSDDFYDITIFGIICGVIGARLYYVIFSWDMYKDNLLSIFNLRAGGLGIYGGIIGGALGVYIMSRYKRLAFLKTADIVIPGVLIGQICGRWGNFFNREAFGDYSEGLFRMGLPVDGVRNSLDITDKMRQNMETIDGVDFVFVHPTFLYESFLNLCIFVLILVLKKRLKKNGQCFAIYLLGYGFGRFFIERLRTDQLLIPTVKIPVSMVVSVVAVALGIFLMFRKIPGNAALESKEDMRENFSKENHEDGEKN